MKIKVLFVCLGNICRSPLAEAIFVHKVKQRGWESWIEADSCGTSNYHIGDPPDPRTIRNAVKNGVTISHRCRQLCDRDFHDFHYILPMDNANYRNVLAVVNNDEQFHGKVRMMREFDPLGSGEVPDPYYGGEKGFQEVFDILDRSAEEFLNYLEKQHTPELKS